MDSHLAASADWGPSSTPSPPVPDLAQVLQPWPYHHLGLDCVCCGVCSGHCRMFSSMCFPPTRGQEQFPLQAVPTKTSPETAECPLGNKTFPVENHCSGAQAPKTVKLLTLLLAPTPVFLTCSHPTASPFQPLTLRNTECGSVTPNSKGTVPLPRTAQGDSGTDHERPPEQLGVHHIPAPTLPTAPACGRQGQDDAVLR